MIAHRSVGSRPLAGRAERAPMVLLLLSVLAAAAPGAAQTQGTAAVPDRLATIRDATRHAWEGYRAHAWGHDELRPLSRSGRNWYDASILMTPVDAFDTFLMMGLEEDAAQAKQLILDSLTFDLDVDAQVFEITIRHLGGLLSAYQLDGDPRFLELALDLGDRLRPAFETPTGMPYRYVNLRTGAVRDPVNNPAEIGTLLLEFGTLSMLTGDNTFYNTAKQAMRAVWEGRSDLGLVGETNDVRTGEWRNTNSHLSGRIDSWYEYLLKGCRLFGDVDLCQWWEQGLAAVNRHLADERFHGLWYGAVDMHTGERTATRFGALDAFWPAVLALGGDLEHARALMENVHRMWNLWPVEPERFDYSTMRVTSRGYQLRPEAIESAYYLWWFTGEERYREMGWQMISAVLEHTRTDAGFTVLEDVTTLEKGDLMHSFFLAETLKYAWLLFSDRSALDLQAVVFNTEAHPLRRTW